MSNMENHFDPETRIYLHGHSNVLQVLEDTGFSASSNALGFVVPAPGADTYDSVTVVLQHMAPKNTGFWVASVWRNDGETHVIGADQPHYQFFVLGNSHYLNIFINYIAAGKLNLKGERQYDSIEHGTLYIPFNNRLIFEFDELRDGLDSIVGEFRSPNIKRGTLKVEESKFIDRMEVSCGNRTLQIELAVDEDSGDIQGLRFIDYDVVAGYDISDVVVQNHTWGVVMAQIQAWLAPQHPFTLQDVDIWENVQPYQIAGGRRLPLSVRYTQLCEDKDHDQ